MTKTTDIQNVVARDAAHELTPPPQISGIKVSPQTLEEGKNPLSSALHDFYRCPAQFLDFATNGQMSHGAGYFRFGSEVICFGHTSIGAVKFSPEDELFDAAEAVVLDGHTVKLTFNPDEIIRNLLRESYASGPEYNSGYRSALKKLYYWMRPLFGLSVRRAVQRIRTRNWREYSFPRWPVDTTVENLHEALMGLAMEANGVNRVPFVWFWPRGMHGCVIMTHDVETAQGRDFCPKLMDIDDAHGIKASFQIVPEDRYEVSAEFLKNIIRRGFEIGVQDLNHDGRLFDDREEFLRRAAKINDYVRQYNAAGFRAGVLYRKPEWYDAFDFRYDMSIPNVGHLDPQRGGCCTVLPYFIGNIVELPVTTVQDYMLFHILNQRSIDLWKTQIDFILKKNGLVSFTVHPDYIQENDTQDVYRGLLRYLEKLREEKHLWFGLPREVDQWWRARSQMSVIKRDGAWKVEGNGAEQAVVAFASKVNGKIQYEFS